MSATAKRTFSLTTEQAEFIDSLVERGSHASASEVVRAGLRALQERDAASAEWLRAEVGPAYDAIKADPSRGIPLKTAFDAVRALHAERAKPGG